MSEGTGNWHWIEGRGTRLCELWRGNDKVCDFGDEEQYYPSAGEEPTEDERAFMLAALNAADRHCLTAKALDEGAIDKLVEAARAVEWAGTERDENYCEVSICPWCGEPESMGHLGDCKLAAALTPFKEMT